MKKIIYLIGAFVTTAAIVGAIAVMLNKLKISLSIEGIDDTLDEENEHEHESDASDETEKSVEEALSAMDEDESDAEKDIDVEISEE